MKHFTRRNLELDLSIRDFSLRAGNRCRQCLFLACTDRRRARRAIAIVPAAAGAAEAQRNFPLGNGYIPSLKRAATIVTAAILFIVGFIFPDRDYSSASGNSCYLLFFSTGIWRGIICNRRHIRFTGYPEELCHIRYRTCSSTSIGICKCFIRTRRQICACICCAGSQHDRDHRQNHGQHQCKAEDLSKCTLHKCTSFKFVVFYHYRFPCNQFTIKIKKCNQFLCFPPIFQPFQPLPPHLAW